MSYCNIYLLAITLAGPIESQEMNCSSRFLLLTLVLFCYPSVVSEDQIHEQADVE